MYSKRGCYEVVSRPLTPSGLVVRAVVANLGRLWSLEDLHWKHISVTS